MVWPFSKANKPEPSVSVFNLDEITAKAVDCPDREKYLHGNIGAICVDTFPDNEHNTWSIVKTLHLQSETYIHVKAAPDDVGYPSFVFFLLFTSDDSAADNPAVYAQETEGRFTLLATSSEYREPVPTIILWKEGKV